MTHTNPESLLPVRSNVITNHQSSVKRPHGEPSNGSQRLKGGACQYQLSLGQPTGLAMSKRDHPWNWGGRAFIIIRGWRLHHSSYCTPFLLYVQYQSLSLRPSSWFTAVVSCRLCRNQAQQASARPLRQTRCDMPAAAPNPHSTILRPLPL